MRFRFCGDLDCPDWVLAQIQNLSKLTSVKLKLIVTQVVYCIISKEPKFEKLHELASAAKFDEGDVRAVTAALYFILTSAAKFDTSASSLSSELQQLGLPKEHSTSLSKVYAEKLDDIRQALRDQSFRRSRLAGSGYQTKVGLCSKGLSDPNMRYAKIQMKICNDCGDQKVVNMSVTRSMLDTMIENLETIAAKMEMIKK